MNPAAIHPAPLKTLKAACLVLAVALAGPVAAAGANAAGDPPPLTGRWEGSFIEPVKENGYFHRYPNLYAEVIGLGEGNYRVRFLPQLFRRAHVLHEFDAKEVDGRIVFDGGGWSGVITAGAITGDAMRDTDFPVKFSLRKSGFRSPTLGQAPPPGAVVLFDGKATDAWERSEGGPAGWRLTGDGAMEVTTRQSSAERGGDIRTKESFGDLQLHLEFRLPYEPAGRGQGRANSGVYLQNAFEVQILDSFGLEGGWNECGALYQTMPPKVNACLPPGEWQTYDIDFRAARFHPDGTVSERPRMSVRHNGILIHRDEELPGTTNESFSIEKSAPPPARGPLLLQDHGNLLQFRNIWAVVPDANQP